MKRKEIIVGLIIAAAVAFFLSPFASSWPDGLERVAQNLGFMSREQGALLRSPFADYLFPGLKNEMLAKAAAGLIGTVIMFGIGWVLALLLKKYRGAE